MPNNSLKAAQREERSAQERVRRERAAARLCGMTREQVAAEMQRHLLPARDFLELLQEARILDRSMIITQPLGLVIQWLRVWWVPPKERGQK